MSGADNLSPRQFYTEENLLSQGSVDQVDARTRGIQNMTSNVFKPSFSSDWSTVHSTPSPGAQEEDEEQ